ncbi:MAG: hypothetical protein IKK20_03585, partial [Clostridia bacterium]|nr:hypothetical protein [Clostridia bacterium]
RRAPGFRSSNLKKIFKNKLKNNKKYLFLIKKLFFDFIFAKKYFSKIVFKNFFEIDFDFL